MWELVGGGRIFRSTVESEIDSFISDLLAGRVGIGVIRLVVVWVGVDKIVGFS